MLLVQVKGMNQSLVVYESIFLSFFFYDVFISFLIQYYFGTFIWALTCKINTDKTVYTSQK